MKGPVLQLIPKSVVRLTMLSVMVGGVVVVSMAAAANGKVDVWAQRFGTINEQLRSTGIELLPQPYPKTLGEWLGTRRHFFGLSASAAVLSLGAPFWFNLLKTLTNLRPVLAQQVDKNPKAGVSAEN